MGTEKNISIELSRDKKEGYLTLKSDKNFEGFREKDYDFILEKIKEVIKVPIDEKMIRNILKNRLYDEKFLIASWMEPINGRDGYIKNYFDSKKSMVPKVLEDGTVDYKNLDMVTNVKKGDILSELIPPEDGKNGMRVTGEIIPCRQGKKAFFKRGKNVGISDDGLYAVALKAGQVKYMGNKISVFENLNLSSVDNSTGNINFNGNVTVKENVMNGFTLKAEGDIKIMGIAEGAYIESQGNIFVNTGVQGYGKGEIKAQGNLTTRFIQNSIINCAGDITAETIMHSDVISKGNINVIGKKGLIVGGTYRANREINAKIIGSSMAISTILEVGTDPQIRLKNENVKKTLDDIRNNLDKIDKTIDALEKRGKLSNEKKEMYDKLVYTQKNLYEKMIELNRQYNESKTYIDEMSVGKIKVEDIIHPGVKVIIGNAVLLIRDELRHCTLYNSEGEIRVGPY
ncbi:DUF342 domain-containing protein [Sporanaerobacter sp. PP17-6a]|uniref:DUF342 domain-containing protein n=1 Tax=Sporanaerobacter sp. PP17-6a TaxID=1891289 RepID=UPI00089FA719|nr:FapA family protein [Sporanaerobacter sp. PP17-6a]SCL83004.1 hypothetical protein PP176A_0379 [Sporanaerobacter sp. PP17-6a]